MGAQESQPLLPPCVLAWPLQVIRSKLQEVIKVNKAKHAVSSHCGIVIEGSVLTLLLDPELQDDLMELCKQCKAVVCCRVSPMQKAQVCVCLYLSAHNACVTTQARCALQGSPQCSVAFQTAAVQSSVDLSGGWPQCFHTVR